MRERELPDDGASRPSRSGEAQPGSVRDGLIDEVRDVVARIPERKALTYGDISEIVGRGGPRSVGWAMSHMTEGVPWWRVVRAGGHPPQGHESEAHQRYLDEGMPLSRDLTRVDLRRARLTPEEWIALEGS